MNEMEQFRQELLAACAAEPVCSGRKIITGEGKTGQPAIMLIGEAPGAQEEQQGRPFVGKAGKNLDELLARLSLPRGELWVSNVVKLRPFRVSPRGTVANRPPNRQELAFFTPWLQREIALVQPDLVVTLGNTALHAVAGDGLVIGDCHGAPMAVSHPIFGRITLFPLYHPASIIYNRALIAVWDADVAALGSYLERR